MHFDLLRALACPGCRATYTFDPADGAGAGTLACVGCGVTVPVAAGFPLFGEAFLAGVSRPWATGAELAQAYLGDRHDHERFLHQKSRRPSPDTYAAFQPFNESTRALFPLLSVLRAALKPGDRILDTWGRTAWSGEVLAALFPEQTVVSVWEGDSGVLGYKGYAHWLGAEQRAPNWHVVFHSNERPLPFDTGAFAVVVGLDSLHRYGPLPFLAECMRVCREDGVVVFPHVHMANSEPNPYFDRGGAIRHGRDYRAYFDRLLAGAPRKAYVMSERQLFERETVVIRDEADTSDYNGLILMAGREWEGREMPRGEGEQPLPSSRAVLNPTLTVDASTGAVSIDRDGIGVTHLLERHPVYEERLAKVAVGMLSPEAHRVYLSAGTGRTAAEIAAHVGMSEPEVLETLRALEARELLMVTNVSEAMVGLHHFFARQWKARPVREHRFSTLWRDLPWLYETRPILMADDGSAFGLEEVTLLVDALRLGLASLGLAEGDRVAVYADNHVEYACLFWAGLLSGVVTVAIDPALPTSGVAALIDRVSPKLVVTDLRRAASLPPVDVPVVVLDPTGEEGADDERLLANWLEPWLGAEAPAPAEVSADAPAVMLFTSGSTGEPKGVVLSQGALFRSSELLAREYGWGTRDVVLSLGGFHAMSGLRNPCLATLQAGATVVIPNEAQRSQPLLAIDVAARHEVTILSTVPAFLQRAMTLRDRLQGAPLGALRQILCTGAQLPPSVLAEVESAFGVPVFDYYGLTETCGVCVLTPPGDDRPRAGTIGVPAGAIARVVDDSNQPVVPGAIGELIVHSDNLMLGYHDAPEQTARILRNGWLHTGDLAFVREDGCIQLVGRRDERIKNRLGEIVYPVELELWLARQPGVAEAAVVSYVDAQNDAQTAAFLVLEGPEAPFGEAGARRAMAADLGAAKVPARFELVSELPRSSNGKVLKERLKKEWSL